MSDLDFTNSPLKFQSTNKPPISNYQKDLNKKIQASQKIQKLSHWKAIYSPIYHESQIFTLSPCGSFAALGTSSPDIEILNIEQDIIEQTIQGSSKVTSLSFSPSGHFLLCGFERDLAVWDLLNRKFTLKILMLSKSPAPAIFSANEDFIISSEKIDVVFWNFFQGVEEFRLQGHKNNVLSLARSVDGHAFVSGSEDGSIIFWNLRERKLEFEINAQNKVKSVEISSNGKFVAWIFGNILKVWKFYEKCEVFSFKHVTEVESVKFSPDNKTLASTSNDIFIRIFDLEKKQLVNLYFDVLYDSPQIVFSPDEKTLMICFNYGIITKWNVAKRPKQVSYFQDLEYDEYFVINSDDHKYLGLSSPTQGLKILNVKKKRIDFYLNEKMNKYDFIKVSKNGLLLMTIEKQSLIIWDLKKNEKFFEVDCVFSNLNKFPISKNFSLVVVPVSLTLLSVWNTEKKLKIFDVYREDIKYSAVSFSNDDRLIAFGFEDGFIVVWQVEPLCEVFSLKNNEHIIKNLLFTKDQKYFISTTAFSAYVWNMKERVLEFEIIFESSTKFIAGLIGPYLVLITNKINFWNLNEQYKEFMINSPGNYNNFIFNGKYLLSPHNYHLNYWKFPEYLETQTFDEFERFIPLKFSRNNKYAISGHEKILKLWLVEENKEILSFKAHKNWIRTVSFSYDSRFIVSGGDDCCVKIWELDGTEILCFNGHKSWVLTAEFSRDGKYLISGSHDRVVLFWKFGFDQEVKAIRVLKEVIYSACFSNSGKFIAVETISEVMRILKVRVIL